MSVVRVIDLETTGEKPPEAEVCEVGYSDVHVEDRRVDPSLSWLCGVSAMPPEARSVHHIALADCAGLPPFDQAAALPAEVRFLAAHRAEFELQFIATNLPTICTYKAALRVWPDAPKHSNGTLRYWLEDRGKIAPDHAHTLPAHRAGPDAYVTAHILLALFNEGVTGREMVAWTRQPPMLPRCPIGKQRGKPWAEVDGGFLSWMLRQDDMDAGLKWNAETELNRRGGHP